MALKDRREVAKRAAMEFPIEGTTYTVYMPSAEVGVTVMKLMQIGKDAHEGRDPDVSVLTDDEERDLYARMLGDTWGDLIDAGLDWSDIQAVATTVILWIGQGKAAAEEFWNAGASPGEAPPTPGNRASRRASKGSANTTKKPASGTRTKVSKPRAARTGKKS